MKITFVENVYHTRELNDSQVTEATIFKLRKMIHPSEYLREGSDGKTYLTKDEDGWRHGSVSEERVREATELDKAVFLIIDELRKK